MTLPRSGYRWLWLPPYTPLTLALFCFLTQMKQVAVCDLLRCIDISTLLRDLYGRKLRVASRQPPVSNWSTESNSTQETVSSANTHKHELGSRSFPGWTFRWDQSLNWHLDCNLLETLSQKPQLSHSQIPDYRNCEIVNIIVLIH